MKNILWLASWYPNRVQPYAGDFIERHARSASLYHRVTVLFLVKDERPSTQKDFFVEERQYNDHCKAVILYYRPYSSIPVVERLVSGLRYCIFLAELVRQYIHDNGKPDLVHVHVCWKAGLLALYCKWKYRLSFIVSEHWSAFMPGADPSFHQQSWLDLFLMKEIFQRAAACSAVSSELSAAIANQFPITRPAIIPNVVDTSMFQPIERSNSIFRFIHISEFNYQKNAGQIFQALRLLKLQTGQPFELVVYAPDETAVKKLALQHEVSEMVHFRSYVPQPVLALELAQSDALVLYSRYETFGCVAAEAIAAGVPVIASDIAVMHETIGENCGVFVPLDSPVLLAESMLWMMKNVNHFDPAQLANSAARYSFDHVGKLFDDLYAQVMKPRS